MIHLFPTRVLTNRDIAFTQKSFCDNNGIGIASMTMIYLIIFFPFENGKKGDFQIDEFTEEE